VRETEIIGAAGSARDGCTSGSTGGCGAASCGGLQCAGGGRRAGGRVPKRRASSNLASAPVAPDSHERIDRGLKRHAGRDAHGHRERARRRYERLQLVAEPIVAAVARREAALIRSGRDPRAVGIELELDRALARIGDRRTSHQGEHHRDRKTSHLIVIAGAAHISKFRVVRGMQCFASCKPTP
jgi:hypothetical protein